MAVAAETALDHAADLGDIASVTGLGRAEAYDRWRRTETNAAVALVISQPWPDAVPQSSKSRYDNDRGWWRLGPSVRHDAQYAVVVVDRRVRRVYAIDPTGWQCDSSGNAWRFEAIGATTLTQPQIDAAMVRGVLPARPGERFPAPLNRGCTPWRVGTDVGSNPR
ncbi:hypothetical protein D7D52_32460 [Nocardia yunnanensis]|uniref:Uncharacterized protein n=2 Tax=Nocardia yunnanensis TaxID=2382165 RepID=A0A386ZJJ0_9NOCA|nr:hypothetical protein D7D52_32460 [Nocardia yunnanensis]